MILRDGAWEFFLVNWVAQSVWRLDRMDGTQRHVRGSDQMAVHSCDSRDDPVTGYYE